MWYYYINAIAPNDKPIPINKNILKNLLLEFSKINLYIKKTVRKLDIKNKTSILLKFLYTNKCLCGMMDYNIKTGWFLTQTEERNADDKLQKALETVNWQRYVKKGFGSKG